MPRLCDFCSTSSAAVHCKADDAHLCLSCDAQLHSANEVANRHPRTVLCNSCNNHLTTYEGCVDHGHSRVICNLCDRSRSVTTTTTFSVHLRVSTSSYTGCPAAEDFAAIWGLEMNDGRSTSTSHVESLDILGQILDLQSMQSTIPDLGLCTSETNQIDKMQDQVSVLDHDLNIPEEEYLAFLNLEELIGDEDNQELIIKTQQLLDDDCPSESSSIPVDGSSGSLPLSHPCDTLSSSSNVPQVFDARANAMMRYKQKKHARVYKKKVRYQRKKAIADSRKRVRGRFARN